MCKHFMYGRKKMSKQASFAVNDSQSSKRSVRKWSDDEDVMLVSCMVDLHNKITMQILVLKLVIYLSWKE